MTESVRGRLNYRGDRTGMVGQLVGPSTTGVIYRATDATYDPAADRTSVDLLAVNR